MVAGCAVAPHAAQAQRPQLLPRPNRKAARRLLFPRDAAARRLLRLPSRKLGFDLDELGELEPDVTKFQPFSVKNDLSRAMVGFRSVTPTPDGGALLVCSLQREWLAAAADLLTESFAESMGYLTPYRNFLRRQIRGYLEQHAALPPRAIVLLALALPPGLDPDAGGSGDEGQGSGEPGEPSGDGTAMAGQPSSPSPSSEEDAAEDEAAAAAALGRSDSPFQFTRGSIGGASSSPETSSSDGGGGGEEGPRVPGPSSGAALVGVVELSFSESTRSRALTLNPPADRPYLCNMAVAPAHRRRGHGLRLLAAAEQLLREVGAEDVYLHVRVQDAPAAALYRQGGYAQESADNPLIGLLGLDRRLLLRKGL